MISQTAEYALRAVLCLADMPDNSLTTRQIAKISKIPENYLAKVLQALGRAGLVQSQRGLHGGFILIKPPGKLSILEVINAVDPIKRIKVCPLNLKSHAASLCPLHKRLDDAYGSVEKAFAKSTIGELLAESSGSKPLCESPDR